MGGLSGYEARNHPMNALDALLDGLFDFTGMFPPASLTLEESLRQASAFPVSLRRPHLVGSDVVLAADALPSIDDAALARLGFAEGRKIRLCLLVPSLGPDASAWIKQIETVKRFNTERAKAKTPQEIVSLEVKIPSDASGATSAAVESALRSLEGTKIRFYVEVEWGKTEWKNRLSTLFGFYDGLKKRIPTAVARLGLKVRGSGPTAIDNEILARAIPEINSREIAFKATGGLHHPIRHGSALGFLNIATALRLNLALGPKKFPQESVAQCLASTNPKDFKFDGAIAWKSVTVSQEELQAAMKKIRFNISSSSLTEPDEGLARLFPLEVL